MAHAMRLPALHALVTNMEAIFIKSRGKSMRVVVAIACLVLPMLVQAEEVVHSFTGNADFAYMRSTGSSNKEALKGHADTQYVQNNWAHQFIVDGTNESDKSTGLRTTERYLASEKSSWNFTPRDYLFIKTQYEKDLQTDYAYQALLAAGYGRKLIKTDTMLLNIDLGAGMRRSKNKITEESTNEAVSSATLKYEWIFRPGGRLTEDASMDAGADSTIVRTRTALIFDLTSVVALTIAYETKNDDGPKTIKDTLTTVGLNYRLK
jgi:putative salt-induced outer membrane protein YdiY